MADLRLPALILAAGASRRMGRPKALLAFDGASFVERVAAALAVGGATSVTVVTRADLAEAVAARLGDRARVVVNPTPERGMQSSISVGLAALGCPLEGSAIDVVDGVLIALVDQPALRAETVAALTDAFRHDPRSIVVPRSPEGRRGHPVIFPGALLAELHVAHAEGAREVLWRHAERVRELAVSDVGAFRNVNTPDDLAALESALRHRT